MKMTVGGRKTVDLLPFLALWALGYVVGATHVHGLPSIVGYDPEDLKSEERAASLFERWRARHGRVYREEGERERRFRAFRDNLAYVDRRNRELAGRNRRESHTVGLNRFADLTNEEFKSMYLRKIRRPAKRSNGGEKASKGRLELSSISDDIPSSLDWRTKGVVTPVKDQGLCGSCWAFSSTGAIEGINAITTGNLISLSEQELVDCDTTNYGCDGGYMDYAFEWVIQNGGIDTEADYSYTSYLGRDGVCNATKEERKVVTIDDYEDVAENETALLYAVVSQPVSVGIDGSAIDFQLYTGGIYDGDCSDNPDDIDHAVVIVGYASEGDEDYWIVKNSWGLSWGIGGYIYMKRNTGLPYGLCAINAMASYPIKAVDDSYGAMMKKRRLAKRRFPWIKYAAKKKEANKQLQLFLRGQGRGIAAE